MFKKYIVLECSTEQISTTTLSDSVVLNKIFDKYANAKRHIKDLVINTKKENTDIWCQVEEDFYNEIYTAVLVRDTTVIKVYKTVKLDFSLELPCDNDFCSYGKKRSENNG